MRVLAVPVKSLSSAKTRLSRILSPTERASLTLALLEDVLDACRVQDGWATWVISRDERVLEVGTRWGARPVLERGRSLIAAVRQVEEDCAAGRVNALAVVLGDLPYLRPDDLTTALALEAPVVAAPAASDGGTNLLVRRPPTAIRARFGRASFDKHRWAARRAGVTLTEVRTPGLERDLDTPDDLAALMSSDRAGHARTACIEMGVASRLLRDDATAVEG
ncbi:MAG: 2-phospho-L-lactate guanylyltransferase [Actinomycetota bacterium]